MAYAPSASSGDSARPPQAGSGHSRCPAAPPAPDGAGGAAGRHLASHRRAHRAGRSRGQHRHRGRRAAGVESSEPPRRRRRPGERYIGSGDCTGRTPQAGSCSPIPPRSRSWLTSKCGWTGGATATRSESCGGTPRGAESASHSHITMNGSPRRTAMRSTPFSTSGRGHSAPWQATCSSVRWPTRLPIPGAAP